MKESLQFTLGTNNAAFKSGLAAAKSSVNSFKGEVTGMLTGMFAGVGLQQLVSEFARIQDIADMFGTTAEAVQRVKGAADLAGTSVEAIAKAMAKLRADGGDALAKLGIDAETFANAGMDQQILMISKSLDSITDPQQRINIALEVFGARGKEILPLLAQGYDNLKASIDGVTVASNETVAALARADDQLADMGNKLKVFGAESIGYVTRQIERMSAAALLAWTYTSKLATTLSFSAAADAGGEIIDAYQLTELQKDMKNGSPKKAGSGSWKETADPKAEKEKDKSAKEADDYRVQQNIQILDAAKKSAHEKAQIEKESADYQAESALQVLEYAKKNAKARADLEEKATKAMFEAREQSMGFAGGVTFDNTSGQRVAGVNYDVINAEAEKGIKLQEEMRNYLQTIAAKTWTVEVPDAQ